MATLSGSNISVFDHTAPSGPSFDSSNKSVFNCRISAEFTGTYAQGDNANILLVTTAITDSLRSGETIALLDAAFAHPGMEGTTILGAKTVAVSGTGLTLELTGADLTTEHANAALGTVTKPIMFFVAYTRL